MKQSAALLMALAWPGLSLGQAFIDLDFEAARIQNPPALPGWTITSSNTQFWVDGLSLGGSAVSICDSNLYAGFRPLQGRFSVYLFGGYTPFQPGTGATISQTGLVPAGSRSLWMDVGTGWTPFTVSLGGTPINMQPQWNSGNYTVFAGDITALAGEVATLSLSSLLPNYPAPPPGRFLVDDIQFSPAAVPEPAPLVLLSLALALVLRRGTQT